MWDYTCPAFIQALAGMQHSTAFAYPTKCYFFFSQHLVPYPVQRTHDTPANNEGTVINKAIFIWSELNIKPQFCQEATVCTFLILWVPKTRPQGPFCRAAEHSQLFAKMLAAQPANWYNLQDSIALRAKRSQALTLHLLLLPRVVKRGSLFSLPKPGKQPALSCLLIRSINALSSATRQV